MYLRMVLPFFILLVSIPGLCLAENQNGTCQPMVDGQY